MTTETLTRPAPVEPTTPIKPSEALKLGRLVRPLRVEGRLFKGRDGACAVGAMAIGLGICSGKGRLTAAQTVAVYDAIEDRIRVLRPGLKASGWASHIYESNDMGYSDDDIVKSLEAFGL